MNCGRPVARLDPAGTAFHAAPRKSPGAPSPLAIFMRPLSPGRFPHVSHPVPACRIGRLGGHLGFVTRRKGIAWRRARRRDLQ